MSDESQVFGEDPSLYERFRPGYPQQLMELVVADTSVRPVLEVGAGTGKATRALVALGKHVHALEPDPRMAALLQLTSGDGLIRIDHATLETADLDPASYGLVVAAQSWHWVDREIAYDRVANALAPAGKLALIWHHPVRRQGLFGEAMGQLYAELAPTMTSILPGSKGRDFDPAKEPFSATKRFRSWSRQEHRWQRRLDAPNLIGWLCSQSEHRMLPLEQRTELMAAVAALVEELGGQVVVNMATVAHLAYRV